MAASVLNSPQAIEASVLIMKTFVQLRRMLATTTDVNRRLSTIEEQLSAHGSEIASIMEVLRQLISPKMQAKRRIGFSPKELYAVSQACGILVRLGGSGHAVAQVYFREQEE